MARQPDSGQVWQYVPFVLYTSGGGYHRAGSRRLRHVQLLHDLQRRRAPHLYHG